MNNGEWLTREMQDWVRTNTRLFTNEIKIGHRRMARTDVEEKEVATDWGNISAEYRT